MENNKNTAHNPNTETQQVITPPTYGSASYPAGAGGGSPVAVNGERARAKELLEKAISTTNVWLLAVLAVLFGGVVCRLVVRSVFSPGWGLAAAALLFFVMFLPFIIRKGKGVRPAGVLMAVPYCLLAASFFYNASHSGRFWMVLALAGLFALTATLLSGSTDGPALSLRAVKDSLFTALEATFSNMGACFKLGARAAEGKEKQKSVVGKVIVGLLIALPVVVVLFVTFVCADVAFSAAMRGVTDWLKNIRIDFSGILGDLLFGCVLAVYILPYVVTLRSGYARKEKTVQPKRWLDPIIGATVFFAAAAVYVLFVAVQFRYFFASQLSASFGHDFSVRMELPNEMTWAEYARSGFFELSEIIAVTFIVIGLAMHFCSRNSAGKVPVAMRSALTALAACNLIIIVSAALRMRLYTVWCGLTAKRVGVLLTIAVIAVCLIGLIVKLWCSRFNLERLVGVAVIAAVVLFSCGNIDALCANVNVDRHIEQGTSIDVNYLGQLSCGAAPAVERLMNESPDEDIRNAAKGLLAYYYYSNDNNYGAIYKLQCEPTTGRGTLAHLRAYNIFKKYDLKQEDCRMFLIYSDYCAERAYYAQHDEPFDLSFEEYCEQFDWRFDEDLSYYFYTA